MGHIKEPDGVTLIVEKQNLNIELENKIKDYIKKSKAKNRDFIEDLKATAK